MSLFPSRPLSSAMKTAAEMKLGDGTVAMVRSEGMCRLMALAERVAKHDAAVLIVGETGCGKEVVAKAVHQHSPRFGRAFVDVNCAALPEHLVESELFGYEKGAFSGADSTKAGLFELADQGTLLLDEIGELDGKIQAKLLRVLDGVPYYRLGGSRKVAVNVRVIAATNRNLEEDVRAGRFRSDLYHRLTQFQLQVPPLRERHEDIALLAEFFLQQHVPGAKFSDEAMEVLLGHSWPGNVRELKNVVFKVAMQMKPGSTEVRARDLPSAICGLGAALPAITDVFQGNLDDVERRMVFQALDRTRGNHAKAAEELGISSRTLRRKLARYKVEERGPLGPHQDRSVTAQQRYFRVAVETPVLVRMDGREVEATSVNVSTGGLALRSPVPLPHNQVFEISFELPGTISAIEAKANLAWTAPEGLAGLSITEIHPALQRELHKWVVEHAKESTPV